MKVENGNIFDKIKAMSLPPISQDGAGTSALLEKLETCREQANKMSNRKKRSAAHRAQGEYHSLVRILSAIVIVLECRQNLSSKTRWDTDTLLTSPGFPGYQSVTGWEVCANRCATWAGANGEICEFWQYSDALKRCYFKKRNAQCQAPSKQYKRFRSSKSKCGSCPAPIGSSCGSSKNMIIFSYFFFNLELHSFTKTHFLNCRLAKLGFRVNGLPLIVKQPTYTLKPSFAKQQFRKCIIFSDTLYML